MDERQGTAIRPGQIELISTSAAPPGEEGEYWSDLAAQAGFPFHVLAPRRQTFQGEAVRRNIGAIHMADIRTTACQIVWDQSGISKMSEESLLLYFAMSPHFRADHDAGSTPLPCGAGALHDMARPITLRSAEQAHFMVLHIPRGVIAGRVSGFDRLADTDLQKSSRLLSLVRDYAMHLSLHTPDLDRPMADRLGANLVDLVCAMIADAISQTPLELSEYKAAALVRVKHFVEQHLPDPELKPAMVGEALRLSPRYINQLLQAEGTSLGRLIWQRRLERIAADLRDPALASRDIASIALAQGFRDSSHVSKAFRQRYGMSPREYRHQIESSLR